MSVQGARAQIPVLPTYARADVTIVRGEGCRVWDDAGGEYLDFVAGIAVVGLGHLHPAPLAAAQAQLEQLWHASNLYFTEPMARLATLLSARLGGAQAFFCNSGTEANEAAIKYARKATGRAGIVALDGGFHGRTLGALSATGQPPKWDGFGPLVPGVRFARPNDIESLEAAVTPGGDVALIMLEPVLGEGGVVPLERGVRAGGCRDRSRDGRAALRRRGPGRDGPHRDVLRPRAARDRARSRDAGEGAGERASDRRAPRP